MEATILDTNKPKRGWLLIGWIIFTVILYLWLLSGFTTRYGWHIVQSFYNPDTYLPTLIGIEDLAIPAMLVFIFVSIGAIVALWFWRKSGFYILSLLCIAMVIIYLLFRIPFLLALIPLYNLAIGWIILRKQWHFFR